MVISLFPFGSKISLIRKEMAKSGTGLALIYLHLYFLTGQTMRIFWRRHPLPSNPNDPYYQAFKKVPPAQTTANKFVTNFLHRYPSTFVKRQTREEDIVAVLDGSGSIGHCEFEKAKTALGNLMVSAKESNPTFDTQYAAVTFASSATVNFKFLKYAAAARKIMMIPYPGGGTNTQAGLNEALKLFTNTGSGVRPSGRRAVLLITDGVSTSNRHWTIAIATALKQNGVSIYVIAVGSAFMSGIDEMAKVASSPPQNHLFRVSDLNGFLRVIKLVVKQVAPGKYKIVTRQPYKPCYYHG
ncbi:PREDICTED: collagen alpha-1(XII) chain-like isoform X2 [Acropora digitifera]|uniref:collagen alpha-1(XII) chain-like isoform X2 n=1 Tax=Acropora digitifera TaxID=70779 RepID=UPI00077A7268|nr:PREDICTED: collagen alpha-1(XII) chain-like isoform X2 [Acropora digitifera]